MPAFASDSTLFPEDPVITEGNNAERIPGTTKAFVENVGNGVYYTEITDAYTLSVGIINGNADCAIKYNDKPNTIYSGVFNVDNGCASKGLRTKALEYGHPLFPAVHFHSNRMAILLHHCVRCQQRRP